MSEFPHYIIIAFCVFTHSLTADVSFFRKFTWLVRAKNVMRMCPAHLRVTFSCLLFHAEGWSDAYFRKKAAFAIAGLLDAFTLYSFQWWGGWPGVICCHYHPVQEWVSWTPAVFLWCRARFSCFLSEIQPLFRVHTSVTLDAVVYLCWLLAVQGMLM